MTVKSVKTLLPLMLLCACSEHGSTPEPFGVPITGGTLLISKDGSRAIVSDPDRDRVVQIDLGTEKLISDTPLEQGDEPGRVVEDNAGNVHVALRRGGAVVTLDAVGNITDRTQVCAEPRGIAYDASTDRVHVACTGGELVTLAAAGGAPIRSLRLDRDLRDVIVSGNQLLVTRFKTAEILTLDANGAIVNRVTPPPVSRFDFGGGGIGPEGPDMGGGTGSGGFGAPATVAWRTIALPDGRIVMSHQRRVKSMLDSQQPGGYGGSCGGGPVEDAITVYTPGTGNQPQAVARIGHGALPVDIAASKAGDKLAVVTAGSRVVTVVPSSALLSPDEDMCEPPDPQPCPPTGGEDDTPVPEDGMGTTTGGGAGSGSFPPSMGGGCCPDENHDGRCDGDDDDDDQGGDDRLGPPTSIGWTPGGDLVIFYPEAAALIVRTQGTAVQHRIDLPGNVHNDAGRNVFHRQTVLKVSCESCHPEGRDDGQVWNFAEEGARRTQSLAGHILARAPYHWTGDESSLPVLLDDVFAKRMSGGTLNDRQRNALGPWLNRLDAPVGDSSGDAASIERGRALFESPQAACTGCHNGNLMTNNTIVDVGTGGAFKVPSLLGIGARAPFLHSGCAADLTERFTKCAGASGVHGNTAGMSADQIADLVHYLESL